MAMKYLKVWTNFIDLIKPLEYDEIGRLFEMMLIYAESGAEPDHFEGNERFIFPMARQMIDLAAEKAETLRNNGLQGGRPAKNKDCETKQNQMKPNETKEKQNSGLVPSGSDQKAYKEKERKEKEYKEKELFLDDNDARELQNDQNRVLTAAEDAGFTMSNDVRAALIALYAEHGLEKVLDGLKSCVEHGAPRLAYLRACMTDRPKNEQGPPGKTVTAQQYQQRDYSGEQEEAMKRMLELGGINIA